MWSFLLKLLKSLSYKTSKSFHSNENRKIVDEYVKELLAIELPLFKEKADNEYFTISSVCISIEDIKLILDLLVENSASVNEIDLTIIKCIERIHHINDSHMLVNKDSKIFESIETNEPLDEEELKAARYYVIIQSIKTNKDTEEEDLLGKWEQCLIKILFKTNLNSYCARIEKVLPLNSQYNMVEELFHQIYKEPNEFLLDIKDKGTVKVMAYFLANHFRIADPKCILENIQKLHCHYKELISIDSARYRNIEQHLQLVINFLNNKINAIENEIERYNQDVFQCTIARTFLSLYNCQYKIKKELKKRDNSNKKILKAISDPEPQYTIEFEGKQTSEVSLNE